METGAIEEMFRLEDHHWWFVGKRLLLDALLAADGPPPGGRILDVGCGTGAVLAGLGRHGRPVGIDRSADSLAFCRRRGLVALARADASRLPFRPATFDTVLLLDSLEHVEDELALLAEVRRLLTPAGRLLVSVPAFAFLWSAHDEVLHHLRRYTAPGLRAVLERSGLAVRRLTYTNIFAFPPALAVRGLLPLLGVRRREGTDFRTHARSTNALLLAAYRVEAALLRRLRLPVGLSVAAVATR